jgi:hypothetical protein
MLGSYSTTVIAVVLNNASSGSRDSDVILKFAGQDPFVSLATLISAVPAEFHKCFSLTQFPRLTVVPSDGFVGQRPDEERRSPCRTQRQSGASARWL